MAMGLVGAVQAGWGQNQAIDPINVAGQPSAPAAVSAPMMPIAPIAAPVASVPAVPVAAAVPAVPMTPVIPAPPAAPAMPATADAVPATAPAAPPEVVTNPGPASANDGKAYPVSEVKIGYKFPHPEQPPVGELLDSQIKLGVVADGYVAPRPGVPVVSIKLGDIGKAVPQKLYHSGIAAIYSHVLRQFNAQGIIGVFVVVDSADIKMDPASPDKDEDVRPGTAPACNLWW